MRALVGLFIAFGLAAGIGLLLTWYGVERPLPFLSMKIGPWVADPARGSLLANPYSRAVIARSGEAPLPSSDGLLFVARTDSSGAPLAAGCDYRIEGDFPAARLWTIGVYDPAGRTVANDAARYGLDSGNVVHPAGEPTTIVLSPHARPGNWLPIPASGPFQIALRLYEPAETAPGVGAMLTALPAINRGTCR